MSVNVNDEEMSLRNPSHWCDGRSEQLSQPLSRDIFPTTKIYMTEQVTLWHGARLTRVVPPTPAGTFVLSVLKLAVRNDPDLSSGSITSSQRLD